MHFTYSSSKMEFLDRLLGKPHGARRPVVERKLCRDLHGRGREEGEWTCRTRFAGVWRNLLRIGIPCPGGCLFSLEGPQRGSGQWNLEDNQMGIPAVLRDPIEEEDIFSGFIFCKRKIGGVVCEGHAADSV